jgi:mannose-6-phosphate isomerase-like protein (cupin superfamily)
MSGAAGPNQPPSYTTSPTDVMTFLQVGGDDAPDITDERLGPGDGPPFHSHSWATWEVVLEGRLFVRIGAVDTEVGAGEVFFTPPDVPHGFVVVGDESARVLGFHWPGRFHGLYAEIATAFSADGPPDFGAMVQAAARHDAEILGPPIAAQP